MCPEEVFVGAHQGDQGIQIERGVAPAHQFPWDPVLGEKVPQPDRQLFLDLWPTGRDVTTPAKYPSRWLVEWASPRGRIFPLFTLTISRFCYCRCIDGHGLPKEGEIMDFYDLIRNRESIRDYDPDRPLSGETLDRILEAGRLAPSAANRQPWRFLVVSSAEMLRRVRPCYTRSWFQDAPHILVVVGDVNESWVRQADGYNSLETDLTIAMDHMILAAESEGVATCWIAAFDPAILREALSLKESERVYSITPLGYPRKGFEKKGDKKRKDLDEIVQVL